MTRHFLFTFIGLALALGACTAPEGEEWPTVSFGHDIKATNDAMDKRPEVALAPMPSLTAEDQRGAENPGQFVSTVEGDYRGIAESLTARLGDYNTARRRLGEGRGDGFTEAWLTAQMELSNISQYTEDLTKLRARLSYLGDPLPERGRVLLSQIEARELETRLFVRNEKLRLSTLEPSQP